MSDTSDISYSEDSLEMELTESFDSITTPSISSQSDNMPMPMPIPISSPILPSSPPPPTLVESPYQNNINTFYQTAPDRMDFDMKCLSLIFYHHYDNIKYLECSSKMILPKRLLVEFSKYDNIKYPLTFSINDSNILFGVHEFRADIDHIYIPQDMINNLSIQLDEEVKLTLHNDEIEKGNRVVLKPHTSNFLEIEDHKNYLEDHLTKSYNTLTQNQVICIPYYDTKIYIDILECHPNHTISIIDTDLEVDFEAPYDYVEPPPVVIPEKKDIPKEEDTQTGGKPFVPFSGKGHRLGD